MSQHTIFIAGAILAVIVARRMNPIVGGVLGMLVPLGVCAWGLIQMNQGGTIAFGSIPLSMGAFLCIVVAWFAVEGLGLYRAIKKRSGEARPPA